MPELLQPYIGVDFQPRTRNARKWRSQIIRHGRTFSLGCYLTAEEAGKAFDNAAFYLKDWSNSRANPRFNFPDDWDDENARPNPSDRTLIALGKLRVMLPNWEKVIAKRKSMSVSEQVEDEAFEAMIQLQAGTGKIRDALSFLSGRVKILEAENERLRGEHAVKDRTIEGLQALRSGNIRMQKIDVDTHLGAPQKPGQ